MLAARFLISVRKVGIIVGKIVLAKYAVYIRISGYI